MGPVSYVGTFVLHGMEDNLEDLLAHPQGFGGARTARLLVAGLGRRGWGLSPVKPEIWGWQCDLESELDGARIKVRLGVSPANAEPFDPKSHDGCWLVQLHLRSPGVLPRARALRAAAFAACWEDLKGALAYVGADQVLWDLPVAA